LIKPGAKFSLKIYANFEYPLKNISAVGMTLFITCAYGREGRHVI